MKQRLTGGEGLTRSLSWYVLIIVPGSAGAAVQLHQAAMDEVDALLQQIEGLETLPEGTTESLYREAPAR